MLFGTDFTRTFTKKGLHLNLMCRNINMSNFVERMGRGYMSSIETALEFLALLIIGVLFLLAGIFKLRFPSIYWFLRETEYGEIINTVVMIMLGICVFGAAFDVLF